MWVVADENFFFFFFKGDEKLNSGKKRIRTQNASQRSVDGGP